MSGNVGELPAGCRCYRKAARALLPSDANFWRVYSPVIRVLKDSREHQLICEKVVRHLNLDRSDRVLEEGCGPGIWLAQIDKLVARTVGLDNEARMLAAARSASPRSDFVLADLNRGLPFIDGEFDKIGSILVEGYLRNDQLSRAENFRVLAPGGLIAVVTPRRGASFFRVLAAEARHRKEERKVIDSLRKLPLAAVAIVFGKIAELKAVIGDWHFYDAEKLQEAYRRAGFEIVACEPVYAGQAWLLIARKPAVIDAPDGGSYNKAD